MYDLIQEENKDTHVTQGILTHHNITKRNEDNTHTHTTSTPLQSPHLTYRAQAATGYDFKNPIYTTFVDFGVWGRLGLR